MEWEEERMTWNWRGRAMVGNKIEITYLIVQYSLAIQNNRTGDSNGSCLEVLCLKLEDCRSVRVSLGPGCPDGSLYNSQTLKKYPDCCTCYSGTRDYFVMYLRNIFAVQNLWSFLKKYIVITHESV